MKNVCKGLKNADAKSKAFVMFSLDEMPAEEVVAGIPGALNANNLTRHPTAFALRSRRRIAKTAARYGNSAAPDRLRRIFGKACLLPLPPYFAQGRFVV